MGKNKSNAVLCFKTDGELHKEYKSAGDAVLDLRIEGFKIYYSIKTGRIVKGYDGANPLYITFKFADERIKQIKEPRTPAKIRTATLDFKYILEDFLSVKRKLFDAAIKLKKENNIDPIHQYVIDQILDQNKIK